MTVEEATLPPTEVWPDNASIVNVFVAMSTQWRVGMGGATGLDYGVLPQVMQLCGITPDDQAEIFDGVRVMEDAALETMRNTKK